MSEETRKLNLTPIIEELARVRTDIERMREGLGSFGLDMRSFGGDLKWIKEQAQVEKAELKKIGERVASLEGRMVQNVAEKVTKISIQHESVERRLNILENAENDDSRQNSRIAALELKAASWEARLAAKEKAGAENIETWKWVLGAVLTLFLAAWPAIYDKMFKPPAQAPVKNAPKESPK